MALDTEKMMRDFEIFIESEEGKKSIEKFAQKLEKEDTFNKRWINKFKVHLQAKDDLELAILFENFLTHEEKRRDILYGKGIDGQTSLYDPLLTVFSELGYDAPENAFGMFTSAVYDWRGFRLELYCGQGCFYNLNRV